MQTWIIYYFLVLGEAVSGLSVEFRKLHPEKVWAEAVGRRNILIHRYFGVEVDLVWPVVENDLPVLKRMVQDILTGNIRRTRAESYDSERNPAGFAVHESNGSRLATDEHG